MVKYSIYPHHTILKKNEVYLYITLTNNSQTYLVKKKKKGGGGGQVANNT